MVSPEYILIRQHYGVRTATRSRVPLMNHIDEGLKILDAIGSSDDTKNAFCVHPIIQNDSDLIENFQWLAENTSPVIMGLAMEYRSIANEYLSDKTYSGLKIRLSPLRAVNEMLIADKVQNRKDFDIYHKGSHPETDRLTEYFSQWLAALEIDEQKYQSLRNLISS